MKTKLTLLACLLAAPLAQAEIATIGYDHAEGDYAYFSNRQNAVPTDGGSYAYIPYFNEGWTVIPSGRRAKTTAYIMSTGNVGWTTVKEGAFEFQYRLAYMGVKVRDLKIDKYEHARLSAIGCAARTAHGNEQGEAKSIFSRQNDTGAKSQLQHYWSLARNSGQLHYISCNADHASRHEGDKFTEVTDSYLAFEFRVDRRMAAQLPDSVIIPASSHCVERYATETDTAKLAGRDLTFNIDKTKYPMVFDVKRTPQSDITINYNKARDGNKTITKETLFKIDMMIGAWWKGHLAITPTCAGDAHVCNSISKISIPDVAPHWSQRYHDTVFGKTVKLENQAASQQVNAADWKIKVDFSNMDRIPATQGKRKAQIHYNIEASI
ncbi:hypothetical protein [Photobacterium sanguinicancri]|uniref:hypothetical protein n=1 Tax=Photobacterium sanguinicancri TaxID=875932 RepID=UPI003D10F0CC